MIKFIHKIDTFRLTKVCLLDVCVPGALVREGIGTRFEVP